MLALKNAGKRFGPRVLFLEADWLIRNDEKTALVGANGTGKSTLMKILAGLETLDYGTLDQTRGISIGYLPQEGLRLTGRTVFDECLTVFDELHEMEREIERLASQMAELDHESPEYEAAAERYSMLQDRFHALDGYALDAQVGSVLTGLGFDKQDWTRQTDEFSGGWQMRIALAKLLLAKPNLLLLDEPTNHLDMRAKDVLLEAISGYSGTVVFVSHDRYFIDRLATRVLEIENGAITPYEGNYEDYLRRKEALVTEAPSTTVILSDAARSTAESKDPRSPFSPRNENSGRAFNSSPNTTILIEGGYEETNGAAASPAPRTRRLNPIKQKQLEDRCAFLEEEVPRVEAAIAHTEQQLGVYVSAVETQRLATLAEELRAQLTALTAEWEDLIAQLEA
jgi:ABC-type multidrug transport system ATPase subunit